jgi:predicted acetyltransferase
MSDAQDGYGRPAHGGDIERAGALMAESFGFPPANAGPWFDYAGRENIRVFRRAGSVAGALLLVPMGQFWGGRSVRLCGFAGVAVPPWERGRGVATQMMADGLRELRNDGWPLAALYPATQPVYRRVGFEQAGSRFEIRGRLDALPRGDRELPMRPFRLDELPAIQRAYSEVACGRAGWLDRGSYVWHRVQNPRVLQSLVTAYGYIVGEPGAVEGYAFLTRAPKSTLRGDVLATDMLARTPRAARRLLTLMSDHASMSEELSWHSGPDEPLLLLLREQSFVLQSREAWMIRVVDLERAIAARGYVSGLTASVEIDLVDELFAENAGRWTLEISGGEGRARRGGSGRLRCDARALASMYSGFRNASALAGLGIVQGPPEVLSAADAVFAGQTPSMPDMF